MATSYWDYKGTSAGSSDTNWTSSDSSDSSTTIMTSDTNTQWSGGYNHYIRRILVNCPSHWTTKQVEKFVILVNHETVTGWKVMMVINGNILITDPSVEIRTMKDFIPLLKDRATAGDRNQIDIFFKTNPAEEK